MSKYWAVKVGRKPDIYKSWARAEMQVTKYPHACHQSFMTMAEARKFMGWPPEETPNVSKKDDVKIKKPKRKVTKKEIKEQWSFASLDPMIVEIYTDGSHQRKLDYLGIGAWCRYQDKVYELSAKVTREMLTSYGIAEDAACSNPTAEFIAFAEILKRYVASGVQFKGTLKFSIDCDGVEKWMLEKQKAKAPHIIRVKTTCQALIKTMGCKVEYQHVPAHSGVEGNEYADKLAGRQDEIDTFADLFKQLPN